MKIAITLVLYFSAVSLHAVQADEDITVSHRATIFHHVSDVPADLQNNFVLNHCPSLVLMQDGRVMAAWWSAPFEGAASQRILRAYSSDQGRTWSKAETLQDFPNRADFDPAFVVCGRRTFLFFSATDPIRVHVRHSDDSGNEWSEPVEIAEPNHTTRSNGIRLASGELLVPMHRRGTKAGCVLKSSDEGRTWKQFGSVANPNGEGGEPTIAQLRSGKVMMILRTKDADVWRSISSDKGESWSMPEKTELTGTSSASQLVALRDGLLVLTHNPGPTPLRFPLVVRLSHDDGATWGEPFTLADRPEKTPGWQTSYPSMIELPDGTLLVAWTEIRSHDKRAFGDIRCARLSVSR